MIALGEVTYYRRWDRKRSSRTTKNATAEHAMAVSRGMRDIIVEWVSATETRYYLDGRRVTSDSAFPKAVAS